MTSTVAPPPRASSSCPRPRPWRPSPSPPSAPRPPDPWPPSVQTGQLAHHLDDLDLLVPAAFSITSNSVFSSAPAPPAAAPPPAGPPRHAAAADTPHFSCSSFESWAASSSVSVPLLRRSLRYSPYSPASCECSVVVHYDFLTSDLLLRGALAPRFQDLDQQYVVVSGVTHNNVLLVNWNG